MRDKHSKKGPNSPSVNHRLQMQALESISTKRLIWHVLKRHKFELVSTWAFVVTVVYVFPFLPEMLIGLLVRV